MNAAVAHNIQNNNHHSVAVIPRWSHDRGFLLFLADDVWEPDSVKAFVNSTANVITLSEDEYKTTEPVSERDTQQLITRFKSATGVASVTVRARKKYLKQLKSVVDRLSAGEFTPDVTKLEQAPEAQQAVMQHMASQADTQANMQLVADNAQAPRQKRKYTKRSNAATQRMHQDELQATVTNIKATIGDNPTPDVLQIAADELAAKFSSMIITMIQQASQK